MKKAGKNILLSLIILPVLLFASFAGTYNTLVYENSISYTLKNPGIKDSIVDDTIKLKYPFKDYKDPYSKKKQNSPLYLRNPDNITTEYEYDPKSGEYTIKEKVGGIEFRPPNTMSSQEFAEFTKSESISEYWQEQRTISNKNSSANESFLEKYLNPKLNVNIKGFDKIFGSNVIDIKPQGSAELIFGINVARIENPTLPVNLQRSTTFDFDMKIQMGVTGKIGDKMKVGITYNTEAQFDFENQTTISYTGDEDEIIQSIEAGNVSLPLTGTLITGSQSLFGLKTALQFGKLKVTSIFSQQKSESSTIEVEGGAQKNDYEFQVDEYEANKHFFLAHYFKDNYDRALENLPIINSGINITRIEVWVTNRTGNFENTRNILGLIDLAENDQNIFADNINQVGSGNYPYNKLNNLYDLINNSYTAARDINQVSSVLAPLAPDMLPIIHYAKIENARLLSSNEYSINTKLGYISLNNPLNDDEVLAVAYEYTVAGEVYTVGEFSNAGINAPATLFLKLIKGPALQPNLPTWDLMMKNVYSIGSYQINSEDFKLDIYYNDDETGTTVSYINADNITGVPLLKVMGLDRLNSQLDPQPDGYFDFVDKITINQSTGRIFFPVREPFGTYLRSKITDPTLADKYAFDELYDSTQSKARQTAEKSKFVIKGSYKSTGGAEISLNAFNIPEGSVKASANGIELAEGVDFIVDYNLGKVTIINQGLLESGTPIKISLENNSMFNINRKTLLGTHLDYIISEKLSLGGTILHLSEKPLTNKVNIGSEPISNTIWGVDGTYTNDVPLLTRLIDALPFIETKEMSTIEVSGEFANLIPGHSNAIGKSGNAYIDDFEGAKTSIDLKAQYSWYIASTPKNQPDLFPEGNLIDSLAYGFNRAKLAWYNINTDLVRNTSATPGHITVDDQSNHFVREIPEKEIFPFKESITGYPTILNVTNLAYYPSEKGPYNFDVYPSPYSAGIDESGRLNDPESRWAGIMRRIQTNDFEASNIEFIEFWLMDPFIYETDPDNAGGDLYFNLGYISEDILRDGRKSFENGLPTSSVSNLVDTTTWGLVPLQQSLVNAFDNDPNARFYQDVGLDGLSSVQEQSFFKEYLDSISGLYGPGSEAYQKALNDPSGDNYHYFRGSDYDAAETSILDRYKNFNGQEGNSPTATQSPESYATSATLLPDIEDINLDNTLNEEETYFQYKISIRPEDLMVGKRYVTDMMESTVTLKNKKESKIRWYQFKIPLKNPDKVIGPISDFRSIRFMRLFLKDFKDTIIMRFAQMDLVRSEWRTYESSIPEGSEEIPFPQKEDEQYAISVVSIEENGSRTPVNYVLPPGISRVTDPTNPYLRQLNEQSLMVKVINLNDGDARAAYKNVNLDMRQYRKLQMEIHGEAVDVNELKDKDLTVFLRLGSDYKENYYEVEIPLELTPPGSYNNEIDADRAIVWPVDNRFDFELELLQMIKQRRNNAMREFGSNVQYSTAFKQAVGKMLITVVGNPNLSNIKTVMLGVRNPSQQRAGNSGDDGLPKTGIIWYNELRLTDFIENGGWAANARVSTKLADLGNLTVAGNTSTHGFGSIDQKLDERQKEDIFQYDISSNLELGKFFGQNHRVNIPLFFGISEIFKTPQYNPLDPDILMSTTLADPEISQSEKDELKFNVQDYTRRKSFNITNMRIEGDAEKMAGKKKRFYHISNFTLSLAYNELLTRDIKTEKNILKNYTGGFSYVFNNRPKAVEPFAKMKFFQKKSLQLIKETNFFLAPTMIAFRTDLNRKYQETQLREITNENSVIEPTFKKDFIWNRSYDLKYSLTKALKFDFTALNKSRIDEPYGAINKDDPYYKQKKDTIWMNIKSFGRNLNYTHRLDASYNIPINKIPMFRWTSANARYTATYDWTASPVTADTIVLGNRISNSKTMRLNGTLNFNRLYDKVPYLKQVNDKMKNGGNTEKKYKDVKYAAEKIRLKKNIDKSITHNLLTEDVHIVVKDEKGNEIKGELTVVNANKVKFKAQEDYQNVTLEITGKREIKENIFRILAEGTLNILMGLKNVSISYEETSGTILPGYLPTTKYLGLRQINGQYAPGIPFVLGHQDENFAYESALNGWITRDSLQTSPYQMVFSNPINVKASLEPLKGLKIDISATRMNTKNKNEYYISDAMGVFDAKNILYTGNFSVSFLSIGTAFWKFGENYFSKAYDKFKEYRKDIAWRLATNRSIARLPGSPAYDINAPNLEPITGDPLNDGYPNGYGPLSQEVLIPSFLAAYGGNSPEKVELSPFLRFPMPNWRITYDGLTQLDFIKKFISALSITHSYSSTYNIGSYTTNSAFNWDEQAYDGYSWTRDQVNSLFIPEQEIGTINISETFNPLISADITWVNNLSSKLELRKARNMSLSFSNNQLIDLVSSEIIIGLGYRFDQLPIVIKTARNQQKFQSDLNLRGDFSIIDMMTIIRKIQEDVDQISAGQKGLSLKLSADYALNERFNLKLFYDHTVVAPRISTSFKTSNVKFGVSVRFSLIP